MIKQKFIKPTLKEVYDYMVEQKFQSAKVESEKFINFFEVKDWKIFKKLSMEDWKSAVSNWIMCYYNNPINRNIKTSQSNSEEDWNDILKKIKTE